MATITGNALTIASAPAQCTIQVQALAANVVSGGYVVAGGSLWSRTAADGSFALVLAGGDYKITFAGTASYQINVPGDTGTYNFTDRLTGTITTTSVASPAASGMVPDSVAAGAILVIPANYQLLHFGPFTVAPGGVLTVNGTLVSL